jgi:hypothetical protein
MKERIEHLINVYCDQVFSTDNEAGWHTPSQLDATRYKSNSGSDLLRRTKYSARHCAADLHQPNDRADDKMINETQFLKKKHHDFDFAQWLLHQLKPNQLKAIEAGPKLQLIYKRKPKEQEVADYLEIPKKTYNTRRDTAIQWLEKELVRLEQYECLRIA